MNYRTFKYFLVLLLCMTTGLSCTSDDDSKSSNDDDQAPYDDDDQSQSDDDDDDTTDDDTNDDDDTADDDDDNNDDDSGYSLEYTTIANSVIDNRAVAPAANIDDTFLNVHSDGEISIVYGDFAEIKGNDPSCEEPDYYDDDDDVYSTTERRELFNYNCEILVDSNRKNHVGYILEREYAYYQASYQSDLRLYAAHNHSGSWYPSMVQYSGYYGYYGDDTFTDFSFTLDGADKVHVALSYDNSLFYNYNTSGFWNEVQGIAQGGHYSSIIVDQNEVVHISHASDYDSWDFALTGVLKHVRSNNGNWPDPNLLADDLLWNTHAVVKDGNDCLNITYVSYLMELNYIHDCAGINVHSVIDTGLKHGKTSLAIDVNDDLHLTYFKDSEPFIQYATFPPGHSQQISADPILPFELYPLYLNDSWSRRENFYMAPIAVDTTGSVHIAYKTCGDLTDDNYIHCAQRYATNKSGSWEIETIYENDWQWVELK